MAESPSNITQEIEISMAEELAPEGHGQRQEHLMMHEILQHVYSSPRASQQRQNLNSKAAGSTVGQMVWNMTGTWPKKVGTWPKKVGTWPKKVGAQLHMPIMLSESSHEDVQCPEFPGTFQGMKVNYECNPEADLIAEVGMEEPTGLEMEVMRRQASVYCARDPLGGWKQNHGVLVWVGLDSDEAARLEVVQPFQSPYPPTAKMQMVTERLCALENQVTAWCYKGAVFITMLVSAFAVWRWLRH